MINKPPINWSHFAGTLDPLDAFPSISSTCWDIPIDIPFKKKAEKSHGFSW
jgi:hypothetical protein